MKKAEMSDPLNPVIPRADDFAFYLGAAIHSRQGFDRFRGRIILVTGYRARRQGSAIFSEPRLDIRAVAVSENAASSPLDPLPYRPPRTRVGEGERRSRQLSEESNENWEDGIGVFDAQPPDAFIQLRYAALRGDEERPVHIMSDGTLTE